MKPSAILRSFAFRIYGAFALCILLLLLFNWTLNSFVFADHYRSQKEAVLTTTYESINSWSGDRDSLSAYLEQHTASQNMSILIWNEHRIVYTNAQTAYEPGFGSFPFLAPLDMANNSYTVTDRSATGANGSHTAGDAMTLYGRTQAGINVMLRIPLSDTHESTAIANRFLLWSSLATLAISCVVAVLLVRSFTRPISRLSRMAQSMAALDFRDRYVSTGHDELAELGKNLNTMSQTMEQTLSELKTANARLLGDMEKSERQDEARRSFISNVSHELKTPIALIQTYSEGLRENAAGSPEEREYYCHVIEDEAQRLSQIISRMTMLMQLESGKADLQIERFDIRALCERLLERYAPLFEERRVPLPTLPNESSYVWGDALLIENVLTNYTTNALNHVNEGGCIRIDWHIVSEDVLRIAVYNSGSHIPEEEATHIWESFYKVDKARTRAYGGTGIGLSVVAAIMQVHRMPYGVRNTDEGVEFFIELPIK
ncbi:MAG: HAMP domain-containing histidine kinase [Clostridia bacterium]|nr:HAMP domain-containing histidine kinase [Clostridia bacterium]